MGAYGHFLIDPPETTEDNDFNASKWNLSGFYGPYWAYIPLSLAEGADAIVPPFATVWGGGW